MYTSYKIRVCEHCRHSVHGRPRRKHHSWLLFQYDRWQHWLRAVQRKSMPCKQLDCSHTTGHLFLDNLRNAAECAYCYFQVSEGLYFDMLTCVEVLTLQNVSYKSLHRQKLHFNRDNTFQDKKLWWSICDLGYVQMLIQRDPNVVCC